MDYYAALFDVVENDADLMFDEAPVRRPKTGHTYCTFCQIIRGESPATVLAEWDDALAIVPLGQVTHGHTLIIPKDHVMDAADKPYVTGMTMVRAAEFAKEFGGPFNLITSAGRAATQTQFHLHIHFVPRSDIDRLPVPWGKTNERYRRRPVIRENYGKDHK